MPWVRVDEPYAKPPRIRRPEAPTTWSGPLPLDQGWAELAGVSIDRETGLDLSSCTELTVTASIVRGADLAASRIALDARRSAFDDCDLSQATISSLHGVAFDGCKFVGTDFSGATVHDVSFRRCHFRYASLRMARFRRVELVDCTLAEVDCFELQAEDVEVSGSALDQLNVDRLSATRVDLRGATSLTLTGVDSLAGCLIGDHQVPALAYSLVFAVGTEVQRDEVETDEAGPTVGGA